MNERARKEHILFKLGDNEVHFSTHVWCWPTFNHLMNKMVEFVLCLLQKKKKQLTHMCICIAAVRMHGLFAAFRQILLFKFENFYLPQLCHTCICHYPPLRETFFPTERCLNVLNWFHCARTKLNRMLLNTRNAEKLFMSHVNKCRMRIAHHTLTIWMTNFKR